MSERTTIGGTVYESIGSSNSNLLLKCNGTARIQWGNRLIDLIKNGKLASEDSSTQIYIISDKSEIKSDGIYILKNDQTLQFWVRKKGEQYNLTNADLYISANTKQDLTVEQRTQAMENIGMYCNTLEELYTSGIQNGIVYVLENKTLYTISNGVISEFEAKLKTVTEIKENNDGDFNNTSAKLILAISDSEYIILSEDKIVMHKPVYVKTSCEFGSEGASPEQGYRFYIDHLGSHLDVDYINVRSGTGSFSQGMIIMHYGNIPIPEGWIICDGSSFEIDGITYNTPNLKDKFILAPKEESDETTEKTITETTEESTEESLDPTDYSVLFIMKT